MESDVLIETAEDTCISCGKKIGESERAYVVDGGLICVVCDQVCPVSETAQSKEIEKEIAEEKMLSGRQLARRIALTLIILGTVGKIIGLTEVDFTTEYMLDIILEPLVIYGFVMYVGYPIARRIVGRWEKLPVK